MPPPFRRWSFTQAIDVSDDKTYFALMREWLDIEVFAYGAGGYGSLQEFFILDRYIDLIKPDIILWQFATNDFINNAPDLEALSRINNNGLVRPYLWADQIEYIFPGVVAGASRWSASGSCRLCYIVSNRWRRLRASMTAQTVERDTGIDGQAHAKFLGSVKVTEKIMEIVKSRAEGLPIAVFLVGTGDPYGPEYEQAVAEIAERQKFVLLNGVDHAVRRTEDAGTVVRAEDRAHWNELGHRVVAEAIAVAWKSACLGKSC